MEGRCPTSAVEDRRHGDLQDLPRSPLAKDACLVVIYGLELGRKYNLSSANVIIGRSSKADIQIDQESVSRNHCQDHQHRQVDHAARHGLDQRHLRQRRADRRVRAARRRLHQDRPQHLQVPLAAATSRTPTTRRSTGSPRSTASRRSSTGATSSRRSSARSARALALPPRPVAHHVRHRPLQGDQRQLRPPRRRLRAEAPGDGDQGAIRREDVLARYGGEEFAIVLPEIDGHNAMHVRREDPQARREGAVQVRGHARSR